jgi:hypothetical protein
MQLGRARTGIIAATGIATVALLMAGSRAIARHEQPVASYRDLTAARADGAFARGWLPELLPRSARQLREVHDLDTNARWLAFRADSADLADVTATLAPLTLAQARSSAERRPSHAWLDAPPELGGFNLATARGAQQLGLYFAPAAAYCLAVEWRTGRAWGWSCAPAS